MSTVIFKNNRIGTVITGNMVCDGPTTINVGPGGVECLGPDGRPWKPSGTIGSGKRATEQRTLTGAPTRLVTRLGTVAVGVGQELSCEVTADDNLLQQIVTVVDGDALRIDVEGACVLTSPIEIRLTVPALERVSVKGASAVHIISELQQPEFRCKVSGAGGVFVAGQVETFRARLSGAGTIDAQKLHSRRADLEVSGAGKLSAFASEEARIDLSGVGAVRVLGDPSVRNVEKSGLGTISWT